MAGRPCSGMAVVGLRNYGFDKLVKTIATHWVGENIAGCATDESPGQRLNRQLLSPHRSPLRHENAMLPLMIGMGAPVSAVVALRCSALDCGSRD